MMTGLGGKQRGEGELGSPVAFPERMDRIQIGKKFCGFLGEILRRRSSQEIGAMQASKQPSHFGGNMLGEAEGTAILGHPNGSVASGPAIDVLEQVPVHSAIVRRGEPAAGKRLAGPVRDAQRLKLTEPCRIAQAELVLEDRRAGVAVPVRLGIVEVDAQAFFPNWRAIARRRSSPEAPARSSSSSARFDSDDR